MSTTVDLSPLRVELSPSGSSPHRNSRDVTQSDMTFTSNAYPPPGCPVKAVSYPSASPSSGHPHPGSEALTLTRGASETTQDVSFRNSSPGDISPSGMSGHRIVSSPLEHSRTSRLMCNGSITAPSSLSTDPHSRKSASVLVYDHPSASSPSSSSSAIAFIRHEDGVYNNIPKERTIESPSPVRNNSHLNPSEPSPVQVRDDDDFEDDDEDEVREEDEEDDDEEEENMKEDIRDCVIDEDDEEDEDEDNEARVCSDREEDDQIECAECSLVFNNLQHYMDHTCQRASGSGLSIHENDDRHVRPMSTRLDCTLIYDLDDNVYVVEGQDWSKTLAQRDLHLHDNVLVVRDDQSALNLDRALPLVSRAVFVPSVGSSRLFDCKAEVCFPSSESPGRKSPPVLSCVLHDLRSSHPDQLANLAASRKLSLTLSSHIRLCCVCKASYDTYKAFLHHAIVEHSIDVSHLDQAVIESPHTGGIIHRTGSSKSVTVAFLTPDPRLDLPSPSQLRNANLQQMMWESSSDNVQRRLSELAFFGRSGQYMNGVTLTREKELSRVLGSKPTLPYEDSIPHSRHQSDSAVLKNLVFDQVAAAGPGIRTSLPSLVRPPMKTEGFYKAPMPSLVTSSEKFNSALMKSSSGEQAAHESSLGPRSSPLPLSPKKLPSSSLPPLMTPSNKSGTSAFPGLAALSSAQLPTLSSSSSTVSAPITMHLPSFLGSCDEHPQGRALGVECPKCDMVLGSSQSLGGHMSMSHSRNSCKTLKCPKCNWHYKYQETLEIHMKEKHPDSDAQCVYCLTNQPHPRLARGESYSCGYKPYRCEVCNYSTTTKGNLSIHMQSDKHINNMQDLANGNGEIKMQAQPAQAAQSLPPSSSTAITSNPPVFSQDEAHFKKTVKQKQSFRCDVCSYETSVARNLRIHMTSEKHTHNMLVMTQSLNHLHQDMTLHQMSHMNQLLALSQQDNQARFAVLGSHFPAGMFPYDQAAMMMSGGPNPSSGFDIPMNLTKENALDDWVDNGHNHDASKMFQCCICNKYNSDSVENVHNHIQFDRTKAGNSEAFVTFAHGTYHCNLCTYKTHLKANFQLHCKTDKHLQKLQIVLHMQEGGPDNDWRMAQPNATMQICCNACCYYANSTHKMQLHLTSMQHEACAQLFRHLQLLERTLPPPDSGRHRYYQCSLCPANVRTKQKLVLHSRSARHLRAEHAASHRPMSIFDVFLLKDFGDGDQPEFEDSVTSRSPESTSDNHEAGTLPGPGNPGKNNGNQPLTGGVPLSGVHNQAVNGSNPSLGYLPEDLLTGATRSAVVPHSDATAYKSVLPNSRPVLGNGNHNNTNSSSSGGGGIFPNTNGNTYSSHSSSTSAAHYHHHHQPKSPACILCPLCRHECQDRASLEIHLSREHNVAPEGLSKLMLVVDWPVGSTAHMETSSVLSSSSSSSSSPTSSPSSAPLLPSSSSPSSAPLQSTTSSTVAAAPASSSAPPPPPSSSPSSSATPGSSIVLRASPAAAAISASWQLPTGSFPTASPSSHPSPKSSSPTASTFVVALPPTAQSDLQLTAPGGAGAATTLSSFSSPFTGREVANSSSDNHHRDEAFGETVATTSSIINQATDHHSAAIDGSNPATSSSLSLPHPTSSSSLPPSLPVASSSLSSSSSFSSLSSTRTSSPGFSSSSTPIHTSLLNTLTVTATSTTPTTGLVSAGRTHLDPVPRPMGTPEEVRLAGTPEINPEMLEKEHLRLLKEGVDMSLQDLEDLFRCQTCTKSFANIDQLFAHQNELGHLELKQTPRGPGYLCWKKGCNQYFKTASALQMHFKEIHVKKASVGVLPVKELELYAFRCDQCSFSFKNSSTLKRHFLVHLAQSVTRCRICSKGFSSVDKLKKHLDMGHSDLSASERAAQIETVEMNDAIVKKNPFYASFTSEICLVNGNDNSIHANNIDMNVDESPLQTAKSEVTRDTTEIQTERPFLEDYMNSPALAETNFLDPNRKYKCFTCHMAFTKQSFLVIHNATSQHQEKMIANREKSITTPISSHLANVKGQRFGNETIPNTVGSLVASNSASTMLTTTKSLPNGNHMSVTQETGSSSASKPYRCNICQVSYMHAPGLEIHMRSVAHKTCVNRLGELIQTGQVDVNQSLIDHPDPKVIGKQQAQLIADLIHQQASAQAASNVAASMYGLQGLPNLNAMAQMSMLQGALTSSSQMFSHNAQNTLAAFSVSQMEAYESFRNSSMFSHDKDMKDNHLSQPFSDVGRSVADESSNKISHSISKINARPDYTEKIINMVIKQDGKIEPAAEARMKQLDDKQVKSSIFLSHEMKIGKKDDEPLPPNFPHAPVLTRPRGFMGRFKPQLHRSLLENFGFECVMHFNEETSNSKKSEEVEEEEPDETNGNDSNEEKEDKKNEEEESNELLEEDSREPEKTEKKLEEEVLKEDIMDKEEENKDDKKDENKENIDLPELNKTKCSSCSKYFSSVWVLKNHEEEVHSNFVSPDVIEVFGNKFREEWEKTLPKANDQEMIPPPQTTVASSPSTPTVEKPAQSSDMPPPPPPTQPQLPTTMDMAQLLPLMNMNLLPMPLPMSLVNLGLQSSLMPSLMMPPSLDLSQAFLSQMPPPPLVDSSGNINSQQHLKAAAAAAAAAAQAQNQKRVRTRISDDQLKVLRQYFDINNSPSEEQINKMAEQTGLPQKVIKHWFRNTLFKERQRNKDSPYNFNNPPSTSIDLDEYDRTGIIPEVKLEPEEEEESSSVPISEDKKESIKEEVVMPVHYEKDLHMQDVDPLSSVPLKIDLTPRMGMNEDTKRENDSYSNTSSPSNASSIPSTPTASAPSTPTPVLNSASISANPLSFSLDAYAANLARIEAGSYQNIGKRANRTRFTDFQIKTLQDYFERNAYPKDDELEHLSKLLGLSARVIVVWFQNARQKARKIYENQPNSEPIVCTKESTSPFHQRTPSLNYQCTKCHSVFQRYYELIKHQKNCCYGESNNNTKSIPSVSDEESNSRNSLDDNGAIPDKRMPMFVPEKEIMCRLHNPETFSASTVSSIATAKLPSSSVVTPSTTAVSTSPSSFPPSSSSPSFRCDKCSLTFSRFDTYQDHQKAHNIAPAMFTPFSSSSAFGMLQTLAHQEDTKAAVPSTARTSPGATYPSLPSTPIPAAHQTSPAFLSAVHPTSPSPNSKRKTDSEDEGGDQPRDKRLRTTILPEQLDYLYQQYQIDCNPSRKQLEHIATTVNLKKRVVQVWFQNTRARERKGHYRAHQQLINKRCPFCRALFRAKSALESHMATKHPDELVNTDINIDLIPDAILEIAQAPTNGKMSSSPMPSQMNSDITSKLIPPGTANSMPNSMPNNYLSLMQSAAGLNFSFQEGVGHSSFEDPFFKKYMSELANNAARKDQLSLPGHNKTCTSAPLLGLPSQKPPASNSPIAFSSPRPVDAHKPKISSLPSPIVATSSSSIIDDAPLDLSKPVKSTAAIESVGISSKILPTTAAELMERSIENDYLRRFSNLDDSFSETHSEVADQDYMNDDGNSPPSPSRSGNGTLAGALNNSAASTPNSYHSGASSSKRYRTQMSATQVKVMKHLFMDYKTPTMAECELLGQEIGLAKRVVQVWFQNARAKEKKAKLSSGKPFNPELDFPKSPEECKLCNYKYSHKITVQDHIFTKSHIDRVKKSLRGDGDMDFDYPPASIASTSRSTNQDDSGRKRWDSSLTNAHLAQLQAMGLNPSAMGLTGLGTVDVNKSQHDMAEAAKKEKRPSEGANKEQQTAMEMAMNAQMASALGSYMPGLDPTYLSYMYGTMPGYFPAMGLPMMQPGLLPSVDPMMNFDPLAFGTPLAFLQIPADAIKSVSEKLLESGSILARYTQDCQALADLHSMVSAADLTVAAEATLDVGYICKKCQMVYPAKESCLTHQRTSCLASASGLPKGFEPIIKLEQVQYECRACNERFSTITEFKNHCQQETHRTWLIQYKSRQEKGDSPSPLYMPSASYPSSSNCISSSSPLPSYTSAKTTGSPTNANNNNNNNTCNNNTSSSSHGHPTTKSISPAPAHQLNKMLNTNLFRDKANLHHLAEIHRLKAE